MFHIDINVMSVFGSAKVEQLNIDKWTLIWVVLSAGG